MINKNKQKIIKKIIFNKILYRLYQKTIYKLNHNNLSIKIIIKIINFNKRITNQLL